LRETFNPIFDRIATANFETGPPRQIARSNFAFCFIGDDINIFPT